MIDTPLEIFATGFAAGAVAALLLAAYVSAGEIRRLIGRVSRLRRGLGMIAALDGGPAAQAARSVLEVDAREDARA